MPAMVETSCAMEAHKGQGWGDFQHKITKAEQVPGICNGLADILIMTEDAKRIGYQIGGKVKRRSCSLAPAPQNKSNEAGDQEKSDAKDCQRGMQHIGLLMTGRHAADVSRDSRLARMIFLFGREFTSLCNLGEFSGCGGGRLVFGRQDGDIAESELSLHLCQPLVRNCHVLLGGVERHHRHERVLVDIRADNGRQANGPARCHIGVDQAGGLCQCRVDRFFRNMELCRQSFGNTNFFLFRHAVPQGR
jgi:hypothetical protein